MTWTGAVLSPMNLLAHQLSQLPGVCSFSLFSARDPADESKKRLSGGDCTLSQNYQKAKQGRNGKQPGHQVTMVTWCSGSSSVCGGQKPDKDQFKRAKKSEKMRTCLNSCLQNINYKIGYNGDNPRIGIPDRVEENEVWKSLKGRREAFLVAKVGKEKCRGWSRWI